MYVNIGFIDRFSKHFQYSFYIRILLSSLA